MFKPVVLTSEDTSQLASCSTIACNLSRTYELIFKKSARFIKYSDVHVHTDGNSEFLSHEGRQLAEDIWRFQPPALIFTRDLPRPGPLLSYLSKKAGSARLPVVFCHVYGDFSLEIAKWLGHEEALSKFQIRFICASERQANLLSRFVDTKPDQVAVVPFPIDSDRFFYSKRLREEWRRANGIKPDEFVILYAGRFSLQKNFSALVSELAKLIKGTRRKIWVNLVGSFDDIGHHILGIDFVEGFYRAYWKTQFMQLSPDTRARFTIGELPHQALNGAYNAADLFLSLSLHHDEDFGMAPAEALCTGTRALLTDWGGYADFRSEDACTLIPTILHKGFPALKSSEVQSKLRFELGREQGSNLRKQISQNHAAKYAFENVSKTLEQIIKVSPPYFQRFKQSARDFERVLARRIDLSKKREVYARIYDTYRR